MRPTWKHGFQTTGLTNLFMNTIKYALKLVLVLGTLSAIICGFLYFTLRRPLEPPAEEPMPELNRESYDEFIKQFPDKGK